MGPTCFLGVCHLVSLAIIAYDLVAKHVVGFIAGLVYEILDAALHKPCFFS